MTTRDHVTVLDETCVPLMTTHRNPSPLIATDDEPLPPRGRRSRSCHSSPLIATHLPLIATWQAEPLLPPVLLMHAYGGSAESAAVLLRLGAASSCRVYFGFSPRALRLRRAVAVIESVPSERLLLESDEHTAVAAIPAAAEACRRLAAVRGWDEEEAAARTAANARAALEPGGW